MHTDVVRALLTLRDLATFGANLLIVSMERLSHPLRVKLTILEAMYMEPQLHTKVVRALSAVDR